MRQPQLIIKLSANDYDGTIRFVSEQKLALAEGKKTSVVTITRTGTFTDSRYGQFEISKEMLLAMVSNFKKGAYGQDIFIDVAHKPDDGAAAKLINLSVEGNRLRAEVEWTDYGIKAVKDRGFQYLSAEFHPNFKDNEAGIEHGPTLLGAGLTVRPVIKHLDPVRLSEDQSYPVLIHPALLKKLAEEANMKLSEFIKLLGATLTGFKLSEGIVAQLLVAFETTAITLGEDEAKIKGLMDQFEQTGKKLSEDIAAGSGDIKLSITTSEVGKTLSEGDINDMLDKREQAKTASAVKLAETLTAYQAIFTKLLSESESIKSLDEDTRKTLGEAVDMITGDMSVEQITKLAEHQIKLGTSMSVSAQLGGMGYAPAGSVRISQSDQRTALSLQEKINAGLKQSSQAAIGQLSLAEKTSPFVEKVLSEFDRVNAPAIQRETVLLAGGSTATSDTSLPIGFQRTVIREALSDLRVLELVNTLTDFSATATTQIPYETRDGSAVFNDGIVYENQPIHRASISQAMDTAYILPMKIAFIISNEVMHFSRTSGIDWDAYARNVESNARFMRELIVRRICNEIQRSADTYLSADISAEAIDGQLGAVDTVKTAQFPIVRPHQQRDLQGNAVGSEENPITVTLDGSAIGAYDGTGTQTAATYYRVTNYNLGYIQFVDEAGVPVTPANAAGSDNVSYSYATNIAKVDTDLGSLTLEKRMNDVLRAVGARKAMMSADRFIMPDFMLMSPVLNDDITNAEQFYMQNKKSGTDTDAMGDLATIKNISAWATNAPSVDLGDERIILGQRGTTSYTVSKPFQTGTPFEAVDSTGKPTGQKQAYGEEYSAIKTPTPIRNRLTSVLAYSVTGR
ncbi:MAG: hypothetical protein COB22_07840 [Cycloclasticus sp.]|nr:MAG: hypothetical protein COB22_07840 [Cycloclasticus sp.]